MAIGQRIQHAMVLLFSDKARPLRFMCIGGIAGLIQIGLLDLLTHYGWNHILANATAFLLAAQVNFLFSTLFTWHDRQVAPGAKQSLLRRWLTFHVSISGSALLNMLVFVATSTVIPTLMASALGIVSAAIVNFFVINRFVFGKHVDRTTSTSTTLHALNDIYEE